MLAVVGTTAPTASAAATQDSERLLEVLRPTSGEGIHKSGARVRLKMRRGTRVRVQIRGRDVTGAVGLHRGRRNKQSRKQRGYKIMRGKLPHRLIPPTPTALTVRASRAGRRDVESILVQAVRERRSFMSLRVRTGRSGAAPTARIKTKEHRVFLRVELNGRSIETHATSPRRGVRRLKLTATEGLRHGRNRLVVAANDAAGRGVLKRKTIWIGKRRIIPGVRGATSIRTDAIARLDAGPSFAKGTRRLEQRWRLVSSPRGSQASLGDTDGRKVSLDPDVPGRYKLRLTLARPGGGGAPASHALTVEAQPPIDPYGIAFKASAADGITIADSNTPTPTTPGTVLGVAIDSDTGVAKQAFEIPPTDFQGSPSVDGAALVKAIQGVSPDDLLALAGPGGVALADQTQRDPLEAAVEHLGLDDATASAAAGAVMGAEPFAVLGAADGAPGGGVAATRNAVIDGRLRPTGLTKDLTGTLTFTRINYRGLKLGGVDGTTMASTLAEPGAPLDLALDKPLGAGEVMQAVAIDSATLVPKQIDVGLDGRENRPLRPIQDMLQKYVNDTNTLILFKMKAPTAYEWTITEISAISRALAHLGANRDIFLRSLTFPAQSHTGGEYLFFGGAGVDSPIEASPLITAEAPNGKGPVPLSLPDAAGVVRQDSLSRWVPSTTASSTDDAVTQSLQDLTARAPKAYGYPTDKVAGSEAQYEAAEMNLYKRWTKAAVLCSGTTCSAPQGIRVNYANQELLSKLADARSALRCGGRKLPAPESSPFTQPQLDALRATVCSELNQLHIVHENLFEPLAKSYGELAQDSTLDLLSAQAEMLGFLQNERDRELAKENKFLGIGGEAGAILGELVSVATDVAEYLLAPETGGASILAGNVAAAAFGVAGDSVGIASEARGVGESADKVAPELITVSTLFTYIKKSFGYANARLKETEGLIASDPTKLADVVAGVKDGKWDLLQSVNNSHQMYEVITFQQRVAALQYMLPRMISAVAEPCDTGGSEDDPTTYEAWTAIRSTGETYSKPNVKRLRSAHLTSSDAKSLGPFLFSSPIADADPIAAGPAAAALPRSPFFMTQIAPTSSAKVDSLSSDCGENYE